MYYTNNKNRDEEVFVNDEYDYNENDCIEYEDFTIPNQHIGWKNW